MDIVIKITNFIRSYQYYSYEFIIASEYDVESAPDILDHIKPNSFLSIFLLFRLTLES